MSAHLHSLESMITDIFDGQDEWRHDAMRVIELQQKEIDLLHEQIKKRDDIIERQDDVIDRLEKLVDREKKWYGIF